MNLLSLNRSFHDSRRDTETRLMQLMHLLEMHPDVTAVRSKTDLQLGAMYDLCLRQFTTMKKKWPEMYTKMVFRMALVREPSKDELKTWSFGLVLRRLEDHLTEYFGVPDLMDSTE